MILSLISDFFTWLDTWAITLNAVGSLILSFFLVLLYKRQTALLASQQQLMRYEQEPDLEVENWEVIPDKDSYHLELTISNYGGGRASGLQCQIDLFDGYHIESRDLGAAPAYRVNEDGEDSYASSIRPHSLNTRFRSEPGRGHIDVFEDKRWEYSFKELVEKVWQSVDGPIYGQIRLRYSTQFEEYQQEKVMPAMKIDIRDGQWYTSAVDSIPKEEKYEDKQVVELAESPPENG